LQFRAYRSYWHYKFSSVVRKSSLHTNHYLTQVPNYGAGIGHQLANWNSGLYYARYFHLSYVHAPFSDKKWESFLGLGEGELTEHELRKNGGLKIISLPAFDSMDQDQIDLIGDIISSYNSDSKILFKLEHDQGYKRQCDTSEILSDKFFASSSRKEDKIIYDKNYFNIAVHIRRGDIVVLKEEGLSTGKKRWMDNSYYVKLLKQVLIPLKDKKVKIYLFSQGVEDDFAEFSEFDDVAFCLEMNATNSFLHLTVADLLISSKSSFSYKPALISKGIVIYPQSFWHSYPEAENYVAADDEGNFNHAQLKEQIDLYFKKY
jgi:hypothetical protein